MNIPFLDLRLQYIELKEEIDSTISRTLESGWYILGKECDLFEMELKKYLVGDNEGYVVGLNSGTDALKLSLLTAGVTRGDEVITVANTAIPTATAICSIGATPVFCDVDCNSWLMDPALLESCITSKTKAIIPVHLYGSVCNMELIMSIANKYGLVVVEDVAQALGAEYHGKKCGVIGDFGAFSFYPSKNLGAYGDGGAVFVKKEKQKEVLARLRNYGQSSKYMADLLGGENSRLDELQAAILTVKLKHLDSWNRRREELSQYFCKKLQNLFPDISIQLGYADTKSTYHLFVIKVIKDRRKEVMEKLLLKGIQTLIHYPYPLYLQPAFTAFKEKSNKVDEELCSSVISLPFHQYLKIEEIDYIVESLKISLNIK